MAGLVALCCFLSTAGGQWLEETIYLPDSLCWLTSPQCLVYDSANNTVYVGSGGHPVACNKLQRDGVQLWKT